MLPKKVRVGHVIYKVVEKTGGEVISDDGEKCWGTCDYEKREIDIAVETDAVQKRITLLHEIIHAIDWSMGYTLQEAEVHGLAIGLFGVLVENPKVAEYIQG